MDGTTGRSSGPGDQADEVIVFLEAAHREGLLVDSLLDTLLDFRYARRFGPEPVAEPEPVAVATLPHPAFATRSPARQAPTPLAAPPQPPPAPVESARAAPAPQAVPRPVEPVRPRRERSRAEVWARFARIRSKKLWGTFTADFAANTLTYLGVLLSIVVIYVFFAFGYFGEAIDDSHRQFRPLVEIGVVAFFLGLAWVLRHRTGIPQTATAVEMIGVILVPVMLAASIRDGCTPSYRPYCLPPDIDGPARWAGYGMVGLLSTGIYYLFASRRRIYAYLVGPMLWAAIGAFALYLEDGLRLIRARNPLQLALFTQDGISAAQLIAVLVAIGISIGVAVRTRRTALGRLLAVPTIRAGVVAAPFVLVLSLVFAYNDALSQGIARPTLSDLVWPNFVATAAAAVVFALAAKTGFAWEDLGRRVRRDTVLVLQVAAYLSLAASWLLTAGFGVSPGWLGAGLLGYAVVVALADRYILGPHTAAVWIVRTAIMVGGALALLDPGSALLGWGALGALAVGRAALPAVGKITARFLPVSEDSIQRRIEIAVPLLVATGAGAARLNWPEATPVTLLAAAVVFVAVRLLPDQYAEVRSLAAVPAGLLVVGALGVETYRQLEQIGFEPYPLSAFLVVAAVVVAATSSPAVLRVGSSVGLVGTAAMISLREAIGSGMWETAWIDTAVLGSIGLGLVAAGVVGKERREQLVYGVLGHGMVLAATIRSLSFEETAIAGLGVLAVAHAAEAAAIELGRPGTFERLARRVGEAAPVVRAIPTVVALLALAPLAVLLGRRVPVIAEERARFGPVLAALSWLYLGAAAQRRTRARVVAIPLTYAASAAALAVAIPSVTAGLVTAGSAAAATALLARRMNRPMATLPSWALAVATALLAARWSGVAGRDLYLVLHTAAVLLVVGAATFNRVRREAVERPAGLISDWLVPPVVVGTLLLPAGIALSLADGGFVAWVAVAAALAYGLLGWSTGAGGVSIPLSAALAIAYGSILYDNDLLHPFDQPLSWMPLALVLISWASVLPGNRSWRILIDPAPGFVVSGLGIATLATVYSTPAGVLDLALVICAGLLALIYAIRREELWLGVSGVTLVAAGLVAGDYWAPAATLAASLVVAYFADRKRKLPVAAILRAVAAGGVGATLGLVAIWRQWSTAELAVAAGVAAGVVMAGAVALSSLVSWPTRVRDWARPTHAVAHGLVAATYVAAATDLDPLMPYGVITLLALLEAVAFGVIGSVRRKVEAVGASAGFIAVAYAALVAQQDWSAAQIVGVTATVAATVTLVAAFGFVIGRVPDRLQLWHWPVLALGQAAAAGTLVTAATWFDRSDAAGIAAGVLAFDALVAGTLGTIKRNQVLIAGSAVLAAAAYGFVPQWLGWSRLDFIAYTGIIAAGLAIFATVATRSVMPRLQMWQLPGHGLAGIAVLATMLKTLSGDAGSQEMWVLAAVLVGCAGYLGANAAATPDEWQLRTFSIAAVLLAALLALGAETTRDGAVFAVTVSVAGLALLTSLSAGLLARTQSKWHIELALLSAGLGLTAIFGTVGELGPFGPETGTVLIVIGTALAAYGLLAEELLAVEVALVVWLLALMVLVNHRIDLPLHAAVAGSSTALLGVVEIDRYRRRRAQQSIPAGLHHIEWVLMLAPLILATADMFGSLWFGLVLAVEGALLATWGVFTEVRRRALVGAGAIALAIVLSAVIPALHGIQAGLAGGTWLAIGAGAATLFLVAGSTIERRRTAIGRRLAHLAEILEEWE